MLAGSHIFIASSGLMARLAASSFSCISAIRASCIGLTSGSPRKVRASSGVQSISMLTFMVHLLVQSPSLAPDAAARKPPRLPAGTWRRIWARKRGGAR